MLLEFSSIAFVFFDKQASVRKSSIKSREAGRKRSGQEISSFLNCWFMLIPIIFDLSVFIPRRKLVPVEWGRLEARRGPAVTPSSVTFAGS